MLNKIKKLFSKNDPKDDEFGRAWSGWRPFISFDKTKHFGLAFSIGIENKLTFFDCKKLTHPRTVQSYCFAIKLSPSKWLWGSSHIYYDGPNCAWDAGPFHIDRTGIWRPKCPCMEDF